MNRDLPVRLRGYHRAQVDQAFARADEAVASGSATLRASARAVLQETRSAMTLGGYDRTEVDREVEQLLTRLDSADGRIAEGRSGPPTPPMPVTFLVALRGYEIRQVDTALAEADQALASESATVRAHALETLRRTRFEQCLRGYSREQVDRAVAHRLTALAPPPNS